MKTILVFICIAFASTAFASTAYNYYCSPTKNSPSAPAMMLRLVGKTLTSDQLGTGKLDPNYNPRPANKNLVRFVGYQGGEGLSELYLEKELLSGGHVMKKGGLGGFMKLRWWAEGGYAQEEYACFLRP